jgi:hypothetical protein
VVCGNEVLTALTPKSYTYRQSSTVTQNFITPNEYKDFFSLTFGPTTSSFCIFDSFQVCEDVNCNTPFSNSRIFIDVSSPPSHDGFYPIKIVTTSTFAEQVFYLGARTRGLKKAAVEVKIKVCEPTIIAATSPLNMTYQPSIGV